MNPTYSYIILAGAILLFAGQFFFRYKVMRSLQTLSKKNIGLGVPQILSKRRLYNDVIKDHPEEEEQILSTVGHIRKALAFTLGMALLMAIAFGMMLLK